MSEPPRTEPPAWPNEFGSLVFLSRFLMDLVFIKLAVQLLNAAYFRAQGLGRGQDILFTVNQEIAAGDLSRVKELCQQVGDSLRDAVDTLRRYDEEGGDKAAMAWRCVVTRVRGQSEFPAGNSLCPHSVPLSGGMRSNRWSCWSGFGGRGWSAGRWCLNAGEKYQEHLPSQLEIKVPDTFLTPFLSLTWRMGCGLPEGKQ